MARRSIKSITAQNGTSALASEVLQQYDDWRVDRRDIQLAWQDSRENFQGMLNQFKEMFGRNKRWKEREALDEWRSDSHVNLTKQKVMAAVSIVTDNILQGGQIPFGLSPSEWDRLNFSVMPADITQDTKKGMKEMEMLIRQQFTETHADRELVKVVFSMAEYGEGYNKKVGNPPLTIWGTVSPMDEVFLKE